MKIALVQCPVWGTYDPPMALAQLSSYLRESGHEVFVFDLNIKFYHGRGEAYKNIWAWEQCSFWYNEENLNKFFIDNAELIDKYVNEILNTKSRVVGFSVSSSTFAFSFRIAKRLKDIDKDIVIVFGGPLFYEQRYIEIMTGEKVVDFIIPGEGEFALAELVSLIKKKEDFFKCAGIYYRDKKGYLVYTGERKPVSNLDLIPYLDFSNLPLSDYDDDTHIPFMSSRGCIQRCVFCSSRNFWPVYRTMSGERIFNELEFHKWKQKNFNVNIGHVDFMDLLFNGNMKTLAGFCQLLSRSKLSICWAANMIIRPEMTPEVIKSMRDSGCKHIIFGIESGSQRVLDSMRKHYRIEDADRVIRLMHEAGIMVTGNFMFGFPGETEEDFQLTLDFIKRNAEFLDRAYPSRTYCAIEEFSYLHTHLDEFGIKPGYSNHLYWESLDGKNAYPERLRRCDIFCEQASSLGIEVGSGVQTSVGLDKCYNLGFYYVSRKDYSQAARYFLEYLKLDPQNEAIAEELTRCESELKKMGQTLEPITAEVEISKQEISEVQEKVQTCRVESPSLLKKQQEENSALNDKEFEEKKIILESSPKAFFLQASGPCNSYCVFCSRDKNYEFFDLEAYKVRIEEKIYPQLIKAERLVLNGSGEFLALENPEAILDHFDNTFPHAEKVFATNGSLLSHRICDKIASSKSKYTINVSLHASTSSLHSLLTRTNNFHKILGQLDYLFKLKKDTGNLNINLIFVANTLNIEDLPNFVRMARNLNAEKIICYYNYIYVASQKYLSCFFKQPLANQMFKDVKDIAERLNIRIELPPRFGEANYPDPGVCSEPWNQMMLNLQGGVLPCDVAEDCLDNVGKKDFFAIWNGAHYKNLRSALLEGKAACFRRCLRANPAAVNVFRSHLILKDKNSEDINVSWEDNL